MKIKTIVVSLVFFAVIFAGFCCYAQDQRIGNFTFHSDGTSSQQIGNFTFHSEPDMKSFQWGD